MANYHFTNSSYFRTIDRGYNCISVTTTIVIITIIIIIIIIIAIMMIIIMMIKIMMVMIIKIIIGGHRGLIFMHLLKVYARRVTRKRVTRRLRGMRNHIITKITYLA